MIARHFSDGLKQIIRSGRIGDFAGSSVLINLCVNVFFLSQPMAFCFVSVFRKESSGRGSKNEQLDHKHMMRSLECDVFRIFLIAASSAVFVAFSLAAPLHNQQMKILVFD